MMVGIECLPNDEEEEISWGLVIDLFILRITLIKYNDPGTENPA